MLESYPARYRDAFGQEATTIRNDGKHLRMIIRGVEFKGFMLDDWEPAATIEAAQSTQFSLDHNELRSYSLNFEIPVPVNIQNGIWNGSLRVHLDLGTPMA